uniref:Uncharacterized protein n=1 Tax=Fagus sylvatica TaxID=28930 RepID=A0A2N9EG79_FAGSY
MPLRVQSVKVLSEETRYKSTGDENERLPLKTLLSLVLLTGYSETSSQDASIFALLVDYFEASPQDSSVFSTSC